MYEQTVTWPSNSTGVCTQNHCTAIDFSLGHVLINGLDLCNSDFLLRTSFKRERGSLQPPQWIAAELVIALTLVPTYICQWETAVRDLVFVRLGYLQTIMWTSHGSRSSNNGPHWQVKRSSLTPLWWKTQITVHTLNSAVSSYFAVQILFDILTWRKSRAQNIDNITSSGLNANRISLPLQTRPNMIGTRISNTFHCAHTPIKWPGK